MFRGFEYLPSDIQEKILSENRSFDLSRQYSSSLRMKQLKEESCMDPINRNEIRDVIYNEFMFFDDSNLWYISKRNNRTILVSPEKTSYEIHILVKQPIVDEYKDEVKILVNNNKFIVPYEDILLPPSTVDIVFNKRGNLCSSHREEFKRRYLLDTYNSLDGREQDMWLILNLRSRYSMIETLYVGINDSIYDLANIFYSVQGTKESLSILNVRRDKEKMLELLLK